jgi:K+-transporting ATPase ATPase C chain
MRRQLLPALRILLVFTVVLGVAYPLAVLAVGQLAFADAADGSLIEDASGEVVGSSLLGQSFATEPYFWSRPSASGPLANGTPSTPEAPVDPSDISLASSGGSNLGPTNPDLLDTVADRVDAYRAAHDLAPDAAVPVDAVTSSGSGVDPHISIANARIQAGRVATARGLELAGVLDLVDEHTEARVLGLGEAGVNVLQLNLALDAAE